MADDVAYGQSRSKRQQVAAFAKDNAEFSSGSLAVVLAGVAESYGIQADPMMVAAVAGLMVNLGRRIREWH